MSQTEREKQDAEREDARREERELHSHNDEIKGGYIMPDADRQEAAILRVKFYDHNLAPTQPEAMSDKQRAELSTALFDTFTLHQVEILCLYEGCNVTELCVRLNVRTKPPFVKIARKHGYLY